MQEVQTVPAARKRRRAWPRPKRGEPVCRGVGKNSPLRRVGESRILIPALAGLAQLVARHLAKVEVAGSIPVARSMHSSEPVHIGSFHMARWPSGKAEACKAFIPGSNPGLASNELKGHPTGCPFASVARLGVRGRVGEKGVHAGRRCWRCRRCRRCRQCLRRANGVARGLVPNVENLCAEALEKTPPCAGWGSRVY